MITSHRIVIVVADTYHDKRTVTQKLHNKRSNDIDPDMIYNDIMI